MSMETKGSAGAPGPGPNDRFERRDVNVGNLLKLGVGLVIVIAVVMVGMRWTFEAYEKAQPLGPTVSPMVKSEQVTPPSPQLQAHPEEDLQTYCTGEEQKLDSYGWVDKQAGVVRLPIDRAMTLLLQRGLPTRSAAQTSAAAAASELPPDTTAVPSTPYIQGQCGYVVSELEATMPKEKE